MYGGSIPRPALGTINVILTRPGSDIWVSSKVMSIVRGSNLEAKNQTPKRARVVTLTLSFLEEDKQGTLQPQDDALVVTIGIKGYNVKRVLVDQGSGVEIMYPDLYQGLNLRLKDLDKYDSPLMGFDGKMVVPQGMVKLPVQVSDVEVQVNFIVVETFFPYTAILARTQLHVVGELVGDHAMARQCQVLAITQWSSSSATVTKGPILQQLKGLTGGSSLRHQENHLRSQKK